MFVLGLISGIVIGILDSIVVFVLMAYFRRTIEYKTTIIEKQIESKGPRPKGFIIEPLSEADEVREKIIRKNRKLGRDTKIEELV